MMHLKAIILRIFREKSWFGLTTNYERKYVRKSFLANLGSRTFRNFSPIQIVMVPPEETNISKLLTAVLVFSRSLSFKVGTVALYLRAFLTQ